MSEFKTHTCNEISLEDVGKKSKNSRICRNNKRFRRVSFSRY